MGRLSNITYRKLTKKLKKFDFKFLRQAAGSHEIWYCEETKLYTTIPNHSGDLPEGTIRAILKQADISIENFLKTR